MEKNGNDKDWAADTVDASKFSSKSSSSSSSNAAAAHYGSGTHTDRYRYRMDYPCMGVCLIINNKNFHKNTGMNVRNGTDVDAANVSRTFEKLGYKTCLLNDQTVDDMIKKMNEVAKEDHSDNASFVCVLLSHGEQDVIYGTDRCEKLETLFACIKGNRCRSLVGKPKLFFIQACRGSEFDNGIETDSVETDSVVDETSQKIPVEADFLCMYSTVPGFFAWRNVDKGSWFIQSLCESLDKFRGELELMQIMTRVNNKVAFDFESYSNLPGFSAKKQISCAVTMLTKDFYFSSK